MKSTPNLILGLGLAGLVALGAGVLIAPAVRARALLHDQIEALNNELNTPSAGPDTVERLANDLASLRAFAEGRTAQIPVESDLSGLLDTLSRTLSDLGLNERDITTRPPRAVEDAMSLPVTVAVNGPFPSVYRALSVIERLPRLVRVERLRAQIHDGTGKERPRDPAVRAELLIEVFYTPASSASAVADAPVEPVGVKP